MAPDHREFGEAIDRHGADLAAWTDRTLANEVRHAVLADRGLRARLEDAAVLDAGLGMLRDAMDREIAASGAAARVGSAALAAVSRRGLTRRWAAVAAALVVAAGLGSLADVSIVAPADTERYEVVVLDPLVFGPTEVGTP
jgi:hypothetical protein